MHSFYYCQLKEIKWFWDRSLDELHLRLALVDEFCDKSDSNVQYYFPKLKVSLTEFVN